MGIGKSKSKPSPRDGLANNDWKLVDWQKPEHVVPLDKWIKHFGFKGELKVKPLLELREQILKKCKNNAGKAEKWGMSSLEYRIQIARKREDGMRRAQSEKKGDKKDKKGEIKEEEKQSDDEKKDVMYHISIKVSIKKQYREVYIQTLGICHPPRMKQGRVRNKIE